jgi:hypothetical protein
MLKFMFLALALFAANIAGSKGILLHKYVKQAYVYGSAEWNAPEHKAAK